MIPPPYDLRPFYQWRDKAVRDLEVFMADAKVEIGRLKAAGDEDLPETCAQAYTKLKGRI
jgi:hypothetical protein